MARSRSLKLGLMTIMSIGAIGLAVSKLVFEPTKPEEILGSGAFVGISVETRFDAIFDLDGTVKVLGSEGRSIGTWHIEDGRLCVRFYTGPYPGQRCKTVRLLGPLSVQVGPNLVLAKLPVDVSQGIQTDR